MRYFGFKPISRSQIKGIVGQGIMGNINFSLQINKEHASEKLKKIMFKYFYNYYKKDKL